jgi:twitching motility protein PilU
VEILLNSPLVADLIFKGEVTEIKELMKRSRELGMQTFDQALFDLYEASQVSFDDALRNADSVNDLRLQIKLNSQRSRERNLSKGAEHLRVEMTEEEIRGRGVLGLRLFDRDKL